MADNITASTNYSGTFRQGTTASLMIKITNFDGLPQDPSAITLTIYDASSAVVLASVPEKATAGFYVYDWIMQTNQAVGNYQVVWTYTIDSVVRTEVQNIVVSSDVVDTLLYSGQPYEIRLGLESYLKCAQCIPVYFEQAKPSIDGQKFRFTFPRWNQTAGVKIYRNKSKILTDGFDINYFTGEVVLDESLTGYDSINADYNFRWFSDEDLNGFLVNAVRAFNSYTPQSGYTLNNIADRWINLIQKQAAVDAIRQMLMCLQFQQPQQVFGGAEGAKSAYDGLKGLKENYEEEIKLIYEQKKLGPYKGLTRSIVTPEYTLPGGRSRWFRYLFSSGV